MIRILLTFAAALMLASCASGPKVVVPKPAIKSIAVTPATTPMNYTVDGRSLAQTIAIPARVLFADSQRREKEQQFTKRMPDAGFKPGEQLTAAIAQELRDLGYRVEVLENLSRDPEDPDDVDIAKLSHTADAVLHLYIREIGVHSRSSGRNYLPRLIAAGRMTAKNYRKDLYYNIMYYGYDADPSDSWTSIVADAKFHYPEFDDVLKNIEQLRGAYLGAVQAMSKRRPTQIHQEIK
jgi:hypothetical protein